MIYICKENKDFEEENNKKTSFIVFIVMINLIEHGNGLKFKNVYVYSKSLYKPKYIYLEKLLNPIADMGYYQLW